METRLFLWLLFWCLLVLAQIVFGGTGLAFFGCCFISESVFMCVTQATVFKLGPYFVGAVIIGIKKKKKRVGNVDFYATVNGALRHSCSGGGLGYDKRLAVFATKQQGGQSVRFSRNKKHV